ncbi:MAG: GNAT family N-acetyltransferase [Ardenticatenales bacterium]|nr:GNAT family N-acetyltransferase [Ardenticatenales bacterium]
MASSLVRRFLGAADEAMVRAYWERAPHAHLFAIPDLDYLGWRDARLSYMGWFEGKQLVGYFMRYALSAQWSFEREEIAAEIAPFLRNERIQFVTGMEATMWPVLQQIQGGCVTRSEPSTVATLPLDALNRDALDASPGQARLATLSDLDGLTAVHIASPDQFNHLDYPARRRALQGAMTDQWRRVYLAETPQGRVAASAQTTAEGRTMGVIGGVVTHPALRGQGYATAATSHLCAALIQENKVPYLYYRRGNTPAARVYEKIGFVPMGDALLAELEWDR